MELIGVNLLTLVTEELRREITLMDLILTNEEELGGDVKAGCSPGCADHEMVEFKILRGESKKQNHES